MPLQTQRRLNSAITCLTGAVETLEVLCNSFNTPFLEHISKAAQSLLIAGQAVRKDTIDCTQLLEQTYRILYSLISLYIKTETGEEISLSTLDQLGQFTETLNKIHTFVEAQQQKSRIKRFLHQGEMTVLLNDCNMGLQQALEGFKVQDANLLRDAANIQKYAQEKHEEVLELIHTMSDKDIASSINTVYLSSHNSSTSISMLPSEPKIFYGREAELLVILKLLKKEEPRIAILGPGGMGKTSLARAILHHPEITAKYEQHRFFVACDSASNRVELAGLIEAHLGLKRGKDPICAVMFPTWH
ncbi:hypothetical protein C8R43DRAFT_1111693 [Mycena crocata]|nr:hypothetical protein C8R43DRAFT_1111693 [Mycena crocata]